MAGYYANNVKDYATAITYLDKILEVDPANVDAQKNKEILQQALNRPQPKGSSPKKTATK